jgi:hypothetical protein
MADKDLEVLEHEKDEVESQPDVIEKVKKPRTQKQIEAFEKVRALRDAKRGERKEIKVKEAEVRTKVVEEKIVKKALAIKKKQILRDAELDAISEDDDIPVEVVKKIMTKYKRKPPITLPPKVETYAPPVMTFI